MDGRDKANIAVAVLLVGGVGFYMYRNRAEPSADPTATEQTATDTGAAPTPPVRARRTMVTVTAEQLFAAYADNEVRADSLYRYKVIKVEGTILTIRSDGGDGLPYAVLAGTLDPRENVQAHFADYEDGVAALHTADRVTVSCFGEGRVRATPILDNCEIVKN